MDEILVPGKRGAPKGNQNARTHGFYSQTLDEAEKRDLELATGVEGLDEEISLLRVKIQSVLRHEPENVELITKTSRTLARLLMTKYNIGKNDNTGIRKAIGNVLKNIALPIGVDVGKKIINM